MWLLPLSTWGQILQHMVGREPDIAVSHVPYTRGFPRWDPHMPDQSWDWAVSPSVPAPSLRILADGGSFSIVLLLERLADPITSI